MNAEQGAELQSWTSRWKRLFVGTFAVLTAAVAALALYAYSIGHRPDSSPERITALEGNLGSLNKNVDSRLGTWNQERDQLRTQVEQTGHDLLRQLDVVKKQTGESFAVLSRKLQAEVDSQMSGLRAKVDGLETSRDTDRAQVASLKQELNQVRGELDKQGRELALTREKIDAGGANTERQLASLKDNTQHVQETAVRTKQDVDSINNKLAVERVDFEVFKGRVRQITPEISMNVTGIDLPYHRATGWVWVMPDRRTVWMRKQSTQEPVVFYGHDDGKKREIVMTGVTRNSVVGYLLLPKSGPGGVAVAAVQ